MNAHPLNKLLSRCHLTLRLASWIVPRKQRTEWRREWEAEVWHWCHFLEESGRLELLQEQEKVAKHCWGSFVDALWHRFNRAAVLHFVADIPRQPKFCVCAWLGLLAVLSAGRPAAFFFDTIAPARYANSDRLLTVGLGERTYWLQPEVLRDAAAGWQAKTDTLDSYSVFAWRPSMVYGKGGPESLLSARVTAGTFALLGVQARLGRVFQDSDGSECGSCVVISDMLWRSQFHSDGNVIGDSLRLNGRSVTVIGVLPPGFRFPVRDIAVFRLFGTNPQAMQRNSEWPGALLRVAQGVGMDTAKRELEKIANQADRLPAEATLRVCSLEDLERQDLRSWAGLLGLSLALLLIFNFGKLARLRETGPRAKVRDSLRWYLFFTAKLTTGLAASFMVSLEVGHLIVVKCSSANAYALANTAVLWVFLLGMHVSLTWAIKDQLQRCRVCLKRFGVRINLGNTGRILTDLTGAEFVCDQGHGTLHVPAMESGCVDSERWTYLDDSWRVLLGSSGPRIPAY